MRRDDKVLIVEDDAVVAGVIEAAGQDLCFTCDRATDGWDAIEKLETRHYSAIVIDTDVPRQSGFGVLTYLNEEIGTDLPNVIVMTSSDQEEIRRKVGANLRVVSKDDAVAEITRVLSASSIE
ncbi:MAG TPA: response regulator [Thermoanaerobaculia bacterium]|nr:response regulator [Thermoanaerobaculia bacterium]